MSVSDDRMPEFAFYYDAWPWRTADGDNTAKNLLLFFDGIAVLFHGHDGLHWDHQWSWLEDQQLVRLIGASSFISGTTTTELVATIQRMVAQNPQVYTAGDNYRPLPRSVPRSYFGYYSEAQEKAATLIEFLVERGLARQKSATSSTLSVTHEVDELLKVTMSRVIRKQGWTSSGTDYSPVREAKKVKFKAFQDTIEASIPVSTGAVVQLDINEVGIDLSRVPFDEVISFRKENGRAYRDYRSSLTKFAADLSLMDNHERKTQLADRRIQLADMSADLRRGLRLGFGTKTSGAMALGLAGAAWATIAGSFAPAAIGTAAAVWGLTKEPKDVGSFTYLFKIKKHLSR